MLCDICKENVATIRLIAIVDRQKTEKYLCPACVAKQKLQVQSEGTRIPGILTAFIGSVSKKETKQPVGQCSGCGMEYEEMMRTAKLGCVQCYKDFKEQMKPLLVRLHGEETWHMGRIPLHADNAMKTHSRIEQIRREIDMAVVLEDFELAAELTAELRELEWQGGNSHG